MADTKDKKRTFRRAFSVAIGLSLLGALLYVIYAPRSVPVETIRIKRGRFEEVISSEGRLRSKDRRLITAFADGQLGRVSLKPGDPLKKGDLITTLYWDFDRPIRSPIDGVVSQVFRESSGPIARAEPIIEVVDPANLEIVVELLTPDAARVEPGDAMRVEISGDEPPIEATVVRISKAGFTKRSALGVEEERTEVIGEPRPQDRARMNRLGHNFHVDTSIVVFTQDDALTVPAGAVFREGSGYGVYRVINDRAKLTPVRIARRGQNEAMVSEGLSEGDLVILYPGDLIRDETKVRPQGGD